MFQNCFFDTFGRSLRSILFQYKFVEQYETTHRKHTLYFSVRKRYTLTRVWIFLSSNREIEETSKNNQRNTWRGTKKQEPLGNPGSCFLVYFFYAKTLIVVIIFPVNSTWLILEFLNFGFPRFDLEHFGLDSSGRPVGFISSNFRQNLP